MQLSGVSRAVCTVGKFSAVVPGAVFGAPCLPLAGGGRGACCYHTCRVRLVEELYILGMPHMERYVAEAAMACDTRDS